MKTLNIPFSDEEYAALKAAKAEKTWRDWLLDQAKKKV